MSGYDDEGRAPLISELPPDRQELEAAAKRILGNADQMSIEGGIEITRRPDDGRIHIDDLELGEVPPRMALSVMDAAKTAAKEQAAVAENAPEKYLDPARNPWLPRTPDGIDPGKDE